MGGDITIEGVNDKEDLEETRQTFSLLGKGCLSMTETSLYDFKVLS